MKTEHEMEMEMARAALKAAETIESAAHKVVNRAREEFYEARKRTYCAVGDFGRAAFEARKAGNEATEEMIAEVTAAFVRAAEAEAAEKAAEGLFLKAERECFEATRRANEACHVITVMEEGGNAE